MARKTKNITIDAEGRDFGKMFVLHEMPADQAERWLVRLVITLANASSNVPEEFLFGGAAAMAEMMTTFQNSLVVAIRAIRGLNYHGVQPLFDEMTPCIKYQPTPKATPVPPEQDIHPGNSSQIEEVSTWLRLRYELLELHLGFSLAAIASSTESGDIQSEATTA